MRIADIRKMCARAPFRPFQLHLTNGETLVVEHPENMSVPEDEAEMFVIWTQHDWNLLEARQVARVSVKRRAAK